MMDSMAQYGNARQKTEVIPKKETGKQRYLERPFVPIAVVGVGAVAALMVLLLLTQAQLSQIGFEISALEQELEVLETQHEKLLISHAKAYHPNRIEEYARQELGMVPPNPDQIRYIQIDTADSSRKEPIE